MDEFREDCVLLNKTVVPDGLGGYTTAYTDGPVFSPAFQYDGSTQAILAEKQGFSRSYTVYVPAGMNLDFHDVFRRVSDSLTFRVTNPGTDRHTPASSQLNLRMIEVERWDIPNDNRG